MSVTLKADNLIWLKGQAATTSKGSLSEVLDRIVTDARAAGRTEDSAVRSVRGTIDLPDDDPGLDQADVYVRSLFDQAVSRPLLVKEKATAFGTTRKAGAAGRTAEREPRRG